jgi:hypothetical protein
MWVVLQILVPAALGPPLFYALRRARTGADRAKRETLRFTVLWVPIAAAIGAAATL